MRKPRERPPARGAAGQLRDLAFATDGDGTAIVEIGFDDDVATLVCAPDGRSSLLFGRGAGRMEVVDEPVRHAARELVRLL
ncbi:MAG TPA: hypothetical protein VEB19_18950, partial [Gemmatimonadaceae bacterium]|nr:hypothetical protein [Gemmatimonadaceae bacterium]